MTPSNYLVTLNIGNYLCDNSRESMLAACSRWNCSFHEITENLIGDQDVCFNKYVGIKKLIETSAVDSVFYCDADVLIRSDTPNPFALFTDETKVYAVRDAHYFAEPISLQNIISWHRDISDTWLRMVHMRLQYPIDIENWVQTSWDWFTIAATFLLHKYNFPILNEFVERIPKEHVNGRMEQATWNYILKNRNCVQLIDPEWSTLEPDLSTGKMLQYVYHFTGPSKNKLRAAMPTFSWKQ